MGQTAEITSGDIKRVYLEAVKSCGNCQDTTSCSFWRREVVIVSDKNGLRHVCPKQG